MSRADGKLDEAHASFLYGESLTSTEKTTLQDQLGVNGASSAIQSYVNSTSAKSFGQPVSTAIVMGDSLGVFTSGLDDGSNGLLVYNSRGYAAQTRSLLNQLIEYTPYTAGGRIPFATGGYSSSQIRSVLLPLVLAATGDAVIWMCGTNDALYGDPSTYVATYVDNIVYMANAIRAAGKYSIFVEPPPIANAVLPGNLGPKIAALWQASEPALIGTGSLYVRSAKALELVPGSRTGIGNPAYFEFNGAGVHFLDSGAALQAKDVRDVMSSCLNLTGVPYSTAGRTNVLTNPQLTPQSGSPGPGRPTGWAVPLIASGATLTESVVDNGDGSYNYRVNYNHGTATSESFVFCNTNTTSTLGSKVCDSIVKFKMVSGSMSRVTLDLYANNLSLSIAQDNYSTRVSGTPATYTFPDGTICLRTPKVTSPSGATQLYPVIRLVGNGTFDIIGSNTEGPQVRTYP